MSELSSVYWIHLEEHSDITCEGYIGVTSGSVKRRFQRHLISAKTENYIISNAIRKHGDKIIVTTLLKGSNEYCYMIEGKLRASARVGWNTAVGGYKSPTQGRKHSELTKQKMSVSARKAAQRGSADLRRGVKRSQEVRDRVKASKSVPWENPISNSSVWLQAANIYDEFIRNNRIGRSGLSKIVGLSSDAIQAIHNKFVKQNWNPHEDAQWQSWFQLNNILKEIK